MRIIKGFDANTMEEHDIIELDWEETLVLHRTTEHIVDKFKDTFRIDQKIEYAIRNKIIGMYKSGKTVDDVIDYSERITKFEFFRNYITADEDKDLGLTVYYKAFDELEKFRESVKNDAINKCYELAIKADIVYSLEYSDYDNDTYEKLLSLPDIVDAIYHRFCKYDTDVMETIRYATMDVASEGK